MWTGRYRKRNAMYTVLPKYDARARDVPSRPRLADRASLVSLNFRRIPNERIVLNLDGDASIITIILARFELYGLED